MSEQDGMEGNPEEKEEVLGPSLTEEMREEVLEVFKIFDKDGDDRIGLLDLGQMLRWLGFNPNDTELKSYMEMYDNANSGQLHMKEVFKIVEEKVN